MATGTFWLPSELPKTGRCRNIVGQEGEAAVKDRIAEWLAANAAITTQVDGAITLLGGDGNLRMIYGAEPDISFERRTANGEWQIIATVEVKSGTDSAGALERLGAIQRVLPKLRPGQKTSRYWES